jgi:hypothetical protein
MGTKMKGKVRTQHYFESGTARRMEPITISRTDKAFLSRLALLIMPDGCERGVIGIIAGRIDTSL